MLRLAEERDYPDVLRMLRSFHESSTYSGISFSEGKIQEFWKYYLENNREIIVILSEQGGRPRGLIVGMISRPPFSDEAVASELAWWMDPEFRRSKDSLLLFDAYQDWAFRVGASMCHMALLASSPDLSKRYEKNGYQKVETTFMRKF